MKNKLRNLFAAVAVMISLFTSDVKAQSPEIIDCLYTLAYVGDEASLPSVADVLSNYSNQGSISISMSDVDLEFIVEVADAAALSQIQIDMGDTPAGSNILADSFTMNASNEVSVHENVIHLKLGNYTINSGQTIHYRIRVQDNTGAYSPYFSGEMVNN